MERRALIALCFLASCSTSGSGVRGDGAADGAVNDGLATGDGAADGAPDDSGDGAAGDGADTGSVGPLPDYASGTRLRAILYATTDGQKLWRGWRDSLLAENCTFRKAEDEKMRCLPASSQAFLFADAACMDPLHVAEPCAPVSYVLSNPGGCGGLAVHKTDVKVTPATVYQWSGTMCMPTTPPAGMDLHRTVKQALTSFVAAAEVRDARGASLAMRYYRADDGAIQPLGPYDTANMQACAPLPEALDRCLPSPVPSTAVRQLLYTDGTCVMPAFPRYKSCGVVTFETNTGATYDEMPTDPCAAFFRKFYRLGAERTGTLYTKTATGCDPAPAPGTGVVYLELGAQVMPADFPALGSVDVGSGRVKLRYQTAMTGEKLQPTTFFDSTTGYACTPATINGTLRCFPSVPPAQFFFDDMCKQAMYFRNVRPGCPPPAPPAHVVTWEQTQCGGRITDVNPHFYSVGAKVAATAFYGIQGSQCIHYSGVDPNNTESYVTTELPATDLATMQDLTE